MKIIKKIYLLAALLFVVTAQAQTNQTVDSKRNNKNMEILEVFKTRKSVRIYLDKSVEQEKLELIAKVGNMAAGTPTVGKRYFNVISDSALLVVNKHCHKV